MSQTLDDDLGRWEAGTLSADEVAARHPDADLRPLTLLHTQLTGVAEAPTPDLDAAWTRVLADLPDRPPRWSRLRRAVAAGLAIGVVAVPTVAYAASTDPVRDVMRGIGDLLGGDHADPAEPTAPESTPADDDDLARLPAGSATTLPPPVTEEPGPTPTAPPSDQGSGPNATDGQNGDDQGPSSDDPVIGGDQGSGVSDGSDGGQDGDEGEDSDGDDPSAGSDGDHGSSQGGEAGSDGPAGQGSEDDQGADES